MKNHLILLSLFILLPLVINGQIGIGTDTPLGALDVTSDTMGLVLPRVTSLENVRDGYGNKAVDGTVVYDISRAKTCFKIAGDWICLGKDESGAVTMEVEEIDFCDLSNYIKASNTGAGDKFGYELVLSNDGNRLAVSTPYEDSNASGIDGDGTNNDALDAGAVYVFAFDGSVWAQEAYIKASNTDADDQMGWGLAIDADGSTLAVGSFREDSGSIIINFGEASNSAMNAGAVYIFERSGSTWSQEAYIKPDNLEAGDQFGISVDLDHSGTLLAVGSNLEDSDGSSSLDNSTPNAGAVYLFEKTGGSWSQIDYLKPSAPDENDFFGRSLKLSGDGQVLAVGAYGESTPTGGINPTDVGFGASFSGAVYLFEDAVGGWNQTDFIKASNPDAGDHFGQDLDLNYNGRYLVVGAHREDSNATGIDGDQLDNSVMWAGAAYVYYDDPSTGWEQEAYIKASNNEDMDRFGWDMTITDDGQFLAITSHFESSNAISFGGDQSDNSENFAGAVFTFKRTESGEWTQEQYIKAINTEHSDIFGNCISISGDGTRMASSASQDDSNATGVGGDPHNNSTLDAGAVFIID